MISSVSKLRQCISRDELLRRQAKHATHKLRILEVAHGLRRRFVKCSYLYPERNVLRENFGKAHSLGLIFPSAGSALKNHLKSK